MRPGAGSGSAPAATDDGSAPATAATGSGCPRLIGGAVRRKYPIL
jgi:hypothetical protein